MFIACSAPKEPKLRGGDIHFALSELEFKEKVWVYKHFVPNGTRRLRNEPGVLQRLIKAKPQRADE